MLPELEFLLLTDQQKRGSILLGIESLKIRELNVMNEISEEGEPGVEAAETKAPSEGFAQSQRRRKSLKRRFSDAIQEAILPSKNVVLNVQRLFASDQALNAERERHLRVNRYAIHPMSVLR